MNTLIFAMSAAILGADASAWDVAAGDLAPASKAPADAWRGRGVAVLVALALDRTPNAAAPRSQVVHAQQLVGRMPSRGWTRGDATRIGRLTLAETVLVGRLSAKGDGLLASCRLVRTSDGKTLARGEFAGGDVFAIAGKLLEWLAIELGVPGKLRLPTKSAAALRLYCDSPALDEAGVPKGDAERLRMLEAVVKADARFAAALGDLGRTAARLDDDSRAKKAFAEMGRLPGFAGRAALLNGRMSEKLGRAALARDSYEKALDDAALKATALYRLGRLEFRAGNAAEAAEMCRKSLAVNRFTAPSAHLLGVIERRSGRDDGAIEWFRRAIEADPLWDKPHDDMAVVLEEQGNLRVAGEHLEQAIRLNPVNARCHRRLAVVLAGGWHYGSAIRHAKRAVELRPTDAVYIQTLGAVYRSAGETDDALAALTKALAFDPNNAVTHYTMALTHDLDGEHGKALASYRRALQLDPSLSECEADLTRAEAEADARRRKAGRAFSCGRVRSGDGDPTALLLLIAACLLPALWRRAARRAPHPA